MAYWLAMRGAPPFKLEPGLDVTIGRGQHCELSVYSTLLSREHARVRWEGEQPVLFDLESLNGCFIGPDRISRYALKDGDVIRLGDFLIKFRECDEPPGVLTETELPTPFELETPEAVEIGSETRLFNRTAALHQKVFEYDEIYWLLEHIEKQAKWITDPWIAEANLAMWFENLGSFQPVFWLLLRLGVIAPLDHAIPLAGKTPKQFAAVCSLTKRGSRLRAVLRSRKVHWNEMAALRYRVRQGKIFKPLRSIARAYRPGRGLTELDVERLLYELEWIYASGLKPELREQELRRLLCLGFLSPAPGAQMSSWYPEDWSGGSVILAERGRAMLEGFRLEE